MRAFPGFPDRAATTRVPTLWLRAVLAEAESLAELKVTLHALRLLDAKRDYPRYVRTSELRADAATLASLQAAGGLSPEDALADGVRLAVARGVFLALPVATARGEAMYRGVGGADGILIASVYAEALRPLQGRRVGDIARERGTDPVEKATPGTIRGDFGLETQFNLVHGSDSPESAAYEIPFFFSTLELV